MSVVSTAVSSKVVKRLTLILFLGQSIASLGLTAAVTVGALAATQLFGTAAVAGVPSTMLVLGGAAGAYLAGRLMALHGRRYGLALGFFVGILGAGLGALALVAAVPLLLFAAYAIMGLSRGALDQGRFAAGDMVEQDQRASAISWVVLGGAVGGIGGASFVSPAGRLATQFGLNELAGPYLATCALFALGSLMIFLFLRPDPREIGRQLIRFAKAVTVDNTPSRTLSQALQSHDIQTAMAAMVLGQVVMTTVMVMTPLQITEHLHHTLDDVAVVIAAHVTGMYLTSPLTGRVADRVGHARTILMGAFVLILACVFAPFANDTVRLSVALFLLGAGWNFCYVAGSTLLTDSLRPKERAPIQGTNDLIVGVVAAVGSLSSGIAFETVGYGGIALAGISLAVSLFGITLWTVQRKNEAMSKG